MKQNTTIVGSVDTFHREKSFTDSEKLFAELSSPSFNNYIAFSTPANALE